jgi:hypothetical protein
VLLQRHHALLQALILRQHGQRLALNCLEVICIGNIADMARFSKSEQRRTCASTVLNNQSSTTLRRSVGSSGRGTTIEVCERRQRTQAHASLLSSVDSPAGFPWQQQAAHPAFSQC